MKKKIGKITVKHFLNKNLKPTRLNGYPVYVTIWFKNKLTKTKSYWWIFVPGDSDPDVQFEEESVLTQESFDEIYEWIYKAMCEERVALENIVRVYYEKYGKNIVNQSPGEIIKHSLRKISDIVSLVFKTKLQNHLARSTDTKVISARLMIRWDELSFINIFDGLSISNDGVNQTAFYKDVLSKHSQDYVLVKLLYQFDEIKSYRFWNWMDASEDYEKKLAAFFKSNHIPTKDANRFIKECHAQLQAYLSAIEIS
jgi:hypothetical protein